MSRVKLFLYIATQPTIILCMILCFIVVIIYQFTYLYIQVFDSYVGACVTHTKNDTFLTGNLYTIAYNYAASGGNTDAYNGINNYNEKTSAYCNSYHTSSNNQYNSDVSDLANIKSVQSDNVDNLNLLHTCIDTTVMDNWFQQACCGKTGYESCTGHELKKFNNSCPTYSLTGEIFQKVSTYIDYGDCRTNTLSSDSISDEAVFDCTALPTCTLTCSVDKTIIKSVTKQCGCYIEWGFNAGFFRFTLALVIYLLINVSRYLVIKGMLRINWRLMTPNLFEYVASCRRNGKFVEPGYRKTGTAYSVLVKENLDKVMRGFKRMGVIFIIIGLALNIPWAVLLRLASIHIAYNPNST